MNFGTQMNADNFAGSKNWTAERSDAGPSASEGERHGWREHKHRYKETRHAFLVLICVHPRSSAVSKIK
ncbi:hypothetical protein [Sulfuricaulis sp.]|uniref:hypothetical protein n=1 Tax=Sulfuricaulis sp. TaxID=2003553 RepID=UPI0025EEB0DA|nr:hypothetical protein [Sulfuricaulis sp.]